IRKQTELNKQRGDNKQEPNGATGRSASLHETQRRNSSEPHAAHGNAVSGYLPGNQPRGDAARDIGVAGRERASFDWLIGRFHHDRASISVGLTSGAVTGKSCSAQITSGRTMRLGRAARIRVIASPAVAARPPS